jgi:hypothetical protein
MGRGKDKFIEQFGGLWADETPDQRKARFDEIRTLNEKIRSGQVRLDEVDKINRRLCELKGISWEFDEPSEED